MKTILFLLSVCVCIVTAAPVMSHHSRSLFHFDKGMTIEGKVTYNRWRFPHVYFEIETINEKNKTETWLIESGSPKSLARQGWSEDSIKVGDNVVVVGNPSIKSDTNHLLLDSVTGEDGKTFYVSSAKRKSGAARKELAASKAKVDIFPSTDFSGTWSRGPKNFRTHDYFTPPKPGTWPLTKLGEASLASYKEIDNPLYTCEEMGLPEITLMSSDFLWKRYEDRIEIYSLWVGYSRTLYLNMDKHPVVIKPSLAGHSIAHFDEGGSFVVDTVGFPSVVKWGIAPSIDSSKHKHVIERYTLNEDGLGMVFTVTVEDPLYLTEPVTMHGTYKKTRDYDPGPYDCDLESASKNLYPPQKKS